MGNEMICRKTKAWDVLNWKDGFQGSGRKVPVRASVRWMENV